MHPNLRWFIPSFHGDIKLERVDDATTSVHAYELTPTEEAAMEILRVRALNGGMLGKAWAEAKDFAALDAKRSPYRSKEGVTILLQAPITKVHTVLAKELKPGRKLLSAYLFSDGTMDEVRSTKSPEGNTKSSDAADEPVLPKASEKQPTAAATVAAPTIGCPVPEFPESEIRATRVLETFLSPEQRADYRRHGVVMATGADTGHQYAITHRGRTANMRNVSMRSLYDMTEDRALCVHDWTVPPPEEMLALLLCVSLPGKEGYIRSLPEALL